MKRKRSMTLSGGLRVNVMPVALLDGDGVGPELMAAGTRALERVSKLDQLELDDRHLPFGGEAVTRSGHPLPAATRTGFRNVDAILVASPNEPALDGVKADLQLAWRVARVQLREAGDLVVVGPVGDWANDIAISRAFSCAASRHGRIVCVGESPEWRDAITPQAARWGGVEGEGTGVGGGLGPLRGRPAALDVGGTGAQLVSPGGRGAPPY